MNGLSRAARLLLAGVFSGAGGVKLGFPKDRLRASMPWVEGFSQGTVRLIGALEILGATGVVGPRATGVLPWLTALASAGLAMIMIGGFATHVRRGEFLRSTSDVVLFVLAVFVARGRMRGDRSAVSSWPAVRACPPSASCSALSETPSMSQRPSPFRPIHDDP